MIKDPPLLTIRRNFPRPSAEELAILANVPTGHAVDAMNGRGALDYRIKPLSPVASPLIGVAVTCYCGPADNLALFAALDVAQVGDILVATTDSSTATSVTGDLLLGMAKNRGILGLVTDGLARDLAGILAVGLPVYCTGLSPNSPARNGPGNVGMPLVVGGMAVDSGDVIIADNDGVVIIPRRDVARVIQQLSDVRAAEAALELKVKAGLQIPDFIQEILSSERITSVE
jgi:4-hydroxy-4-methyl-2-oxoglutarate aldolase